MAKVLTQRAVESAKPKAKRYGKPDGIVPGQQLLVHPSGEKSYAIFPRVNGKQIKVTIGDALLMRLPEARLKGKAILAMTANGEDPREAKQAAIQTASETVEIVAQRFIERHAKVHTRPRTWQETERLLTCEILPRWGKRPISSIRRPDVITLLDQIVDRGVGATANRTLAKAKQMFRWAVERGLLETSPFDHVRRPAPETPRDRVLTDAELSLVSRAANQLAYPAGPFVMFLTLSGHRRNEVSGMCWSELDPGLTLWTLPATRAKNCIEHRVPLAPWVRSILADLPRINDSDFVFTTTGRIPINQPARVKKLLDAAITDLNGGVPMTSWTFHDLRRTMATGMARLGVSLPVVEKVLNHSGGSFGGIAGIYQKFDFADQKRQALESWARHVRLLSEMGSYPKSTVVSLRG